MIHLMAANISREIIPLAPTLPRIRHICRHMRESDAREVYALLPDDDWQALAQMHWAALLRGQYAFFKLFANGDPDAGPVGTPIALFVVSHTTPANAVAGFFATEGFPEIAHGVTRLLRRSIIPALRATGLNRVEVRAMASEPQNCRWLEYLGAHFECDLPFYGKELQTFKQYAWYRSPTAASQEDCKE